MSGSHSRGCDPFEGRQISIKSRQTLKFSKKWFNLIKQGQNKVYFHIIGLQNLQKGRENLINNFWGSPAKKFENPWIK